MASDADAEAEAQLELLDELLQEAGGDVAEQEEVVAISGGAGEEETMSAEDVLQQLDDVTLSLDVAVTEHTSELDHMDPQHEVEGNKEEDDGGITALSDAAGDLAESPLSEVESAAVEEERCTDVEAEAAELVDPNAQEEDVDTSESEKQGDLCTEADTTEALDAEVHPLGEEAEQEVPVVVESGSQQEVEPNSQQEDKQMTESTEAGTLGTLDAEVQPSDELVATTLSDGDDEASVGQDHALVEDAGAYDTVDDNASVLSTEQPTEETVSVNTEELPPTVEPIEGSDLAETVTNVEAADPQSRDASSDGLWEAVVPPPAGEMDSSAMESTMPPPAPTHPATTTPQPVFSGSLNPDSAGNGDDDKEDSDSDDDDDDESNSPPPPPLPLGAVLGDDDEELEVDAAVAEEILAATKQKEDPPASAATADEQPTSVANPLLSALESIDLVPKSLDTTDAFSKTDEFAVGFDDAVEVRSAQVIVPPVAHPESSVVAFGIGYQSLRKRPDNTTSSAGDDTYHIATGPTFQELEREVTLVSDVSLSSQQQNVDAAPNTEDDEFGSIPDDGSAASPTRVDAILQKTRTSFAAQSVEVQEAALVAELKKATVHEKQHLHDSDNASARSTSSKPEGDNELTLKELHSIYKRGLGDQEVRMLEDEDDATRSSAYDTAGGKESSSTDPPVAVGGVLSKPALTAHAIAEEEGEEDDDGGRDQERGRRGGDDTLNEEDADAVSMHSERLTFGDDRANAPPREEGDWKEIQLAPAAPSGASSTQNPATDANACSKISYAEALQYFLESEDVLAHRDRIVAEEKPASASCFSCFARPRLAFSGAIEQRDGLFCVAATSFDARNAVHVRMLQTIYRRLVNSGSNRDVPLMGPHWETIGFQGTDPSTDLRGCGVLSLLLMLHVVESHAEFARRFHAVSQHPVRHFPLACAMINVTLQCLMALRSGALYKECNKRSSVFEAANVLHVAIATQLMKEIQSSSEEIPLVMKRVLDSGRLHPDRAIEAHAMASAAAGGAGKQHAPSSRKSSATAGRASSSHAAADFTEIGLHSVGDDA